MEPTKVVIIIEIIKMLCPYLADMAERTESPFDDAIVKTVCTLVGAAETEQNK
jgi:hypothetical protein